MTDDDLSGRHGRSRAASALFALASAALLMLVVALIAMFAWPDEETRIGIVEAATLEPGVPFHSSRYGVFVVRLDDGRVLAFSEESPHLRDPLEWVSAEEMRETGRPEPRWLEQSPTGVFIDPGHGETFAVDGTRLFGPAPHDLDRYPVAIEDGWVVVDVSQVIAGARDRREAASSSSTATAVATPPRARTPTPAGTPPASGLPGIRLTLGDPFDLPTGLVLFATVKGNLEADAPAGAVVRANREGAEVRVETVFDASRAALGADRYITGATVVGDDLFVLVCDEGYCGPMGPPSDAVTAIHRSSDLGESWEVADRLDGAYVVLGSHRDRLLLGRLPEDVSAGEQAPRYFWWPGMEEVDVPEHDDGIRPLVLPSGDLAWWRRGLLVSGDTALGGLAKTDGARERSRAAAALVSPEGRIAVVSQYREGDGPPSYRLFALDLRDAIALPGQAYLVYGPYRSVAPQAWLDGHRVVAQASFRAAELGLNGSDAGPARSLPAVLDIDSGVVSPIVEPFAQPPTALGGYSVVGFARQWRLALAGEDRLVELVDEVLAGPERLVELTARVDALCSFHGEIFEHCEERGLGTHDHFEAVVVSDNLFCEGCEVPPEYLRAALEGLWWHGWTPLTSFWGGADPAPRPAGMSAWRGVEVLAAWRLDTETRAHIAGRWPGLTARYAIAFRSVEPGGNDEVTGFLVYSEPSDEQRIAVVQPLTESWTAEHAATAVGRGRWERLY